MRSWSLHPKLLDRKGLVACWAETIQGKKALLNESKMHKFHPQLNRFKKCENPIEAIDTYLNHIYVEATSRGYKFNTKYFDKTNKSLKLSVSKKQLSFERCLLNSKLEVRDKLRISNTIEAHPIFQVVDDYNDDIEKGSDIIKEWGI